jgi:hypothetical protein
MPQLELIVRGAKKEQAGLPITPAILLQLWWVWEKQATKWDNVMLWAAFCVCFLGFLWSGDLVAPPDGEFDPGQHLAFGDVSVDDCVAGKSRLKAGEICRP